ncbi:MAG: radical SAM family heme chaperone HemW [Planctomycetota bacterium]|nr:radical SAM family heme chaperone HemW [Planctomycetota bacterium]MDA1262024.1 radical SAM family heme chaperone HemW [Planctomycetota bacterium]
MAQPKSVPLTVAGSLAQSAGSGGSATSQATLKSTANATVSATAHATAKDAGALAKGASFRGAYFHVPFCRHKCHYCDFYSFVDTEDRALAYVQRLEEELQDALEFLTVPIETVFVGGGTPTMLGADLLARMLASIRRTLPIATSAEWSVEANPETVNEAVADALAQSGVRRVSLGAQSFNPKLLKALERDHDPASVDRAVGLLRKAGIPQVNLDLIFAIPGSTIADWEADLLRALSIGPDHLSAYGLVYEPNTPLTVKLRKGSVTRLPEDDEAEQYEFVVEKLAKSGYERYEISNWSLPSMACRHNILYWENADWWAFGPSAAGHGNGVRWRNIPRLATWLENRPSAPVEEIECLGADANAGESFMLGLRLMKGMPLERVERLLKCGENAPRRRRSIETFTVDGLLEQVDGHLRLSARGFMIADTVLSALI